MPFGRRFLRAVLVAAALATVAAPAASASVLSKAYHVPVGIRVQGATTNYLWLGGNVIGAHSPAPGGHNRIARVDAHGKVRVFTPGDVGLPASWSNTGELRSFVGGPGDRLWFGFRDKDQAGLGTLTPSGALQRPIIEASNFEDSIDWWVLSVDSDGSVWAYRNEVATTNEEPRGSGSIVHLTLAGGRTTYPIDLGAQPDTSVGGNGVLGMGGALWFWGSSVTNDNLPTGLVRFKNGAAHLVSRKVGPPFSMAAAGGGALWEAGESGLKHVSASGKVRRICPIAPTRVPLKVRSPVTLARDGHGRVWFSDQTTGSAHITALIGYIDRKLAVHLVPIPHTVAIKNPEVIRGPHGGIWLEVPDRTTTLYRVTRVPHTKTVCRGLLKH